MFNSYRYRCFLLRDVSFGETAAFCDRDRVVVSQGGLSRLILLEEIDFVYA